MKERKIIKYAVLVKKYGYPQTLEEYYKFNTRGKSIWLQT